jgi:ABC-type transport system involved in multi-copper enzyme maturation permease subunit
MFWILVQKELKSILLSPKFAATFGTCSILILLSVFIGIQDYKSNVKQYEAAKQLVDNEMSQSNSWISVRNKAFREPDPMQIFVSGVNNDIGRFSNINNWSSIKLQNSNYSDDPIFALFRFLDFAFIVLIVLSLFAILFTYDAINGEREGGTLKLVFSNVIPRAKFILAKTLGSWLGLMVPLLIPILLSLLLIFVYNIPFNTEHLIKLFLLITISILFFTFYMSFGIFISALTRRSAVSFLLLLVSWVLFTFIVPRIGIMIAGQIIDVPTVAQIESQQESFAREKWNKWGEELKKIWDTRMELMKGKSEEEKGAYRDENGWQWMQEEDKMRKEVEKEITENSIKLNEELRNKRIVQEKLSFSLSRFSPSSQFQLAAMNLAGTDITLKNRNEDVMQSYKKVFTDFIQKKQKESGETGLFRITVDSKKGVSFDDGRKQSSLDLSELPRFKDPEQSLSAVLSSIIIDIGLLILFTLISFIGAFIAFLRYDLR